MNKPKFGFTLIELLVVISIIGTIAAVVLVNIGDARARARDAVRIEVAHQLNLALELYYDKFEEYPYWTGSGSDEGVCAEEGDGKVRLEAALVNNGYIAALPKDPKYNSDLCGFDGETTYPGNSDCNCLSYRTNGPKEQKIFVKMEKESKVAESDGGLYNSVYEAYGQTAGSDEIAFSTSTTPCQPSWVCTSWEACQSNVQTRICTDTNNCGTPDNKPAEWQSCATITATTTCSLTVDNICPSGCAAGSDADCCTQAGKYWWLGQGCYSTPPTSTTTVSCSWIADNTCPVGCAAGSDADCCTQAGKYVLIAHMPQNDPACQKSCYLTNYASGTSPCMPCDDVADGTCPNWCSAGSDIDCCTQAGKYWRPGQGCYSTP